MCLLRQKSVSYKIWMSHLISPLTMRTGTKTLNVLIGRKILIDLLGFRVRFSKLFNEGLAVLREVGRKKGLPGQCRILRTCPVEDILKIACSELCCVVYLEKNRQDMKEPHENFAMLACSTRMHICFYGILKMRF